MSTKTIERAEVKATVTDVDQQRVIEFYALTFRDTPDKQGDRIDPGAVDDWLDAFYKGGFPMPISFTHAAVKNPTDPFAIIGYAPADAEHVFKDDRGLRVRAYLDVGSNQTAQQVYTLAKRGIINRASVAYIAEAEMKDPLHKGGMLIQKMRVMESGLCLDPADDNAELMSVKSAEVERALEVIRTAIDDPEDLPAAKAVDGSGWDGNRAMSACSTAAEYRSICAAERTVGDPDERLHWALPHHYLGRGPNAAGVAAAKGRLGQTQNLKSRDAAQAHLDAHGREIENTRAASNDQADVTTTDESVNVTISLGDYEDLREKAGRRISAATGATIRAALEALRSLLEDVEQEDSEGKANAEEPETANAEEPSLNEEIRVRLAAL